MANEFFTILTKTGQSKLSAAIASGTPLSLTTMALGDGLNGAGYTPTDVQTTLMHEVYSAPINAIYPDPTNANYLVVEMVVPDTAGGWTVREAMVKDASGTAFAVANFPDTYKPQLSSGSNKQLHIKMVLAVATPAAVTLSVDATAVYATRDYVSSAVLPFITQAQLAQELQPFLPKSQYDTDYTTLLETFITGPQLMAALNEYATTGVMNIAMRALKSELLAGPTFTAPPSAPTPEILDKSNKLATTEYVREVGFSFSDARFISSTSTLNPVDIGALLIVSGNTGPITITLPLTSGLPLGTPLFIFNGSVYPVTILPNGGSIIAGGINQAGVILGANDDAAIATTTVGAGAKWQLVGGALVNMYSGQFKYQASNAGFQMFPGGIIRQWGSGSTNSSGYGDVTFPISFTASVYEAKATPTTFTTDLWTRSIQWANDVYIGSLTKTRFLMRRDASKLCIGTFVYEVLGK